MELRVRVHVPEREMAEGWYVDRLARIAAVEAHRLFKTCKPSCERLKTTHTFAGRQIEVVYEGDNTAILRLAPGKIESNCDYLAFINRDGGHYGNCTGELAMYIDDVTFACSDTGELTAIPHYHEHPAFRQGKEARRVDGRRSCDDLPPNPYPNTQYAWFAWQAGFYSAEMRRDCNA